MIPILGPFLAARLSNSFKPFAGLISWLIVIAFILCGWQIAVHVHDANVIERHDNKVTSKTLKTDSAAKVEAAFQRGRDEAQISNNERIRNEAINNGPANKPSDASIRANCQRLQRAGRDTSRIAVCAGLAAGSKATNH